MKIKIDIVSDVACPWCYVGKQRLERALSIVPEIDEALSNRCFPT